MAGDELTGHPDGTRAVVEAYAAAVTERLDAPAAVLTDIRDEVADGLSEAIDEFRRRGLSPDDAARAALAEFGAPTSTAAAFDGEVRLARARRTGLCLMLTGPVVGLLWVATAVVTGTPASLAAPAGLWAVLTVIALAVAVGAAAAELAVAASGRLSRRLGRPGLAPTAATVACAAALVADVAILGVVGTYVVLGNGSVSPIPVLAAVVASLLRMTFTGRTMVRTFARINSS
jgi:hypothetical protein